MVNVYIQMLHKNSGPQFYILPVTTPISPSLKLFRIVGDETRLKLLMILRRSEFTAGELVKALGIHQSNASRHLAQLREGELVDDRREGATIYYRWSDALRASKELVDMLDAAWRETPEHAAINDLAESLLAQRRAKAQEFFSSVAGRYHKIAEPGGGYEALTRSLGHLLQYRHAVDIGCGQGDVTVLLARGCKKVTAVDLNQTMLDLVASRFLRDGHTNIEVRQGDMENLPLPNACADLVVASQVLHHTASPEQALKEMLRILEPGGIFLILDLQAHDQEWVREQLGDLWLGFALDRVRTWLQDLPCQILASETVHVQEGLPAMMVTGKKQE